MSAADFLANLVFEEWESSEKQVSVPSELRPADQDGRLAVMGGRLLMREPRGRGAWPVLVPGPGVEVRQGERLLTKPTVLESVEDISITVGYQPPVSEYQLTVSRDKMKVILKTKFRPGTVFKLCDADFQQRLVIKSKPAGTLPAKPIDPRLVLAELQRAGGKAEFIDTQQVIKACLGCCDAEVVVAQGIQPLPPVDGRVELVCQLQSRVPSVQSGDRVDVLDRGRFNAVNAGDVLAYIHPPVPGKPGMNVYGREVQPRAPRPPRFSAGPGVKLIRDGSVAVAEITGRPIFRGGQLQVNPQLVVDGNVDVSTGHVEFRGDVVVFGDVQESLTVKAGGMVEINGSVYHATVLSDTGVKIAGKLIGGTVAAGTKQPGLAKAVKLLRRLDRDLEQLLAAFGQLKGQLKAEAGAVHGRGDGYLFKLLLETRLAHVPKRWAELKELLTGAAAEACGEDFLESLAVLRFLADRFLGAAPLEIKGASEVERYRELMEDLTSRLEECLESEADISVHYCQNAKIEATGSVAITGPLAYDCEVVAGNTLRMAGQCRSGSYTAQSAIYAKTVGSQGMGVATLVVGEEGVIGARTFYPGVKLRIGPHETTIEEECRNRQFYVRDGKLMSRTYQPRETVG